MAVVVETSRGAVRGLGGEAAEGRCARFLGIPYAAPPVGERRFRPPAPHPPWSGVRDALAFGPAPPQRGGELLALLGTAAPDAGDEDCLTLNVYTPGPGGSPRPVMVWLHGGAFICGTGGVPLHDGRRLALRGDVVVVTLNYRVGALGYLYLDGSEGEGAPACANLGLQDQIAALGWVRENIAAFGGEPGRVTLFGESAGAGSICALMAAPAARGLFHGAIVQSAAPDGFLTPDEARERTARLLDVLGAQPCDLRELAVDALLDAQHACAAERIWKTGMFFAPVVDGEVLPERPMQAARAGRASRVPLLIGTLRDELQLYKYGAPAPALGDDVVRGLIAGQVAGVAQDGRPRADVVLDRYRAARTARGESTAGIDLVYAVQTDLAMRGPAIRLAEHHARHVADTWMYLFDWPSPIQEGELGACHALDLAFTFGQLDQPGIEALSGGGETPRRISQAMMDAWLAFAREGRPRADVLGEWPRYDRDARWTMILGASCGAVRAPREEERAALEATVAAETP